MRVLIVIPARYASIRFPGKPLVGLKGATGESRSLIQRSWEAALAVEGADRVVVATDDGRIADAVAEFGGEAVMTPESCTNGTERCAAALDELGGEADLIVNLQGDAPLTPPWFIEALIGAMAEDNAIETATPVLAAGESHKAALIADRKAGRVGATTAVFGRNRDALYFSKEVLPFGEGPVYHHVGVYAYRPDPLRAYAGLPVGELEAAEGLEQLRFLENGIAMRCVEVEDRGRPFWELNNPEDVPRIEAMMAEMGMP